jgi:hypothetical protein
MKKNYKPLLQIIKINLVSYFADSAGFSAASTQKAGLQFFVALPFLIMLHPSLSHN